MVVSRANSLLKEGPTLPNFAVNLAEIGWCSWQTNFGPRIWKGKSNNIIIENVLTRLQSHLSARVADGKTWIIRWRICNSDRKTVGQWLYFSWTPGERAFLTLLATRPEVFKDRRGPAEIKITEGQFNYGPVFETTYINLYICSFTRPLLCFVLSPKVSRFFFSRVRFRWRFVNRELKQWRRRRQGRRLAKNGFKFYSRIL